MHTAREKSRAVFLASEMKLRYTVSDIYEDGRIWQ